MIGVEEKQLHLSLPSINLFTQFIHLIESDVDLSPKSGLLGDAGIDLSPF
jgi:hypothetical protein